MKHSYFMKRLCVRIPIPLLVVSLALTFSVVSGYAQQPVFTPFHANGIYKLGEKAGWKVTLPPGPAPSATSFHYVIKENNFKVITTGDFDLSSGSATIEASLNEPAMLFVEVTPKAASMPTAMSGQKGSDASGRKHAAILLGAAIAPWKLKPSVQRPADFDAFWNRKLKALGRIPMDPVLTPGPISKPGVEFYTVKLISLGSHVRGYLARPSRKGKFPALVMLQWAGVYALPPNMVADRAAKGWLAFDVDSHDMPPNQATGVSPNYPAIGNTSRETSYFLDMYMRDVRAIDYIATRPDWDGKTIVLLGTSMGGQQSLVAAGLDRKVTAVIVNEPSGCDTNGNLHGRAAGYPNWPSDNPQIMKTALYFDPVNFGHRIKAPVLAAMGFIDTTAPPVGIWIALNQVPGPKEAIPLVDSEHNNLTPDKIWPFTSRSEEVLKTILHGGKFVPNEELTRGAD
jgi:cephalosporin-C deacetylase